MKTSDPSVKVSLSEAIKSGAEATRAALEAGADPNQADQHGNHPLFALLMRFQHEFDGDALALPLLAELLKAGANPNAQGADASMETMESASILHRVAWSSWPLCARALLEAGAEVNALDTSGFRPIDSLDLGGSAPATASATLLTVEALMGAGASLERQGGGWVSPLCLAVINNNLPLVKGMLALGANPNERAMDGKTALHYAVGANMSPGATSSFDLGERGALMASALLESGADPRAVDDGGRDVLFFAQGPAKAVALAASERADLGAMPMTAGLSKPLKL